MHTAEWQCFSDTVEEEDKAALLQVIISEQELMLSSKLTSHFSVNFFEEY